MNNVIMVEEMLKGIKDEKERVNKKFSDGLYSSYDYRARCAEIANFTDIIINAAEKEHSKEAINSLIKKYLID